MKELPTLTCLLLILPFGLILGLMLIVYENGVQFGLYRKLKCKLGKHTHKVGYKGHINRYFCKFCKAPRSNPSLKAIDGGKKDLYKF